MVHKSLNDSTPDYLTNLFTRAKSILSHNTRSANYGIIPNTCVWLIICSKIHLFIFIFIYLYSHSSIYIHIHLFIFTFIYLYSYSSTQFCRITGCGGAGSPPPPPIIFERLKLPQQIIYRRKRNLSESPNHQKCWRNILISRFYEQFSRNSRILGHFWKFEKISNS